MIKVYDRKNKEYKEEKQYGKKTLHFLYNTILGRILLRVITMRFISKIVGIYFDSSLSKNKINKFIKDNNIDMNDYEEIEYKSFNQFFCRNKKSIKFENDKDIFISPADSKLLVYKIDKDLKLSIKNSVYTLKELIKDDSILDKYKEGNCLIFRLCVDNYHRYINVDDGKLINNKYIKGILHTVSPVSKDYKVFSENCREVSYIDTKNFNEIIQIEVGATLVGKITNNHKKEFKKGSEKGYFEYGGSTIIIITDNSIKIDKDIIANSKKGIETLVSCGEGIGRKLYK